MGCHEKCCYIRTRDVQQHYYGVVLLKLLYTTSHLKVRMLFAFAAIVDLAVLLFRFL